MKYLENVLLGLLIVLLCSCLKPNSTNQLKISIPSIQQEATSIWRTINDISFLESQGYQIHLPQHEIIDTLLKKSKEKKFGNNDFAKIYQILESDIYDKSKYTLAWNKVKEQEDLINSLIRRLINTQSSWNWGFKTFATYEVVFTLYGTGGSYDPDRGLVTLFTNQEGKFMKYKNPANTIMHEIVHMGIEQSLVQELQISHGVKERIVDKITFILFGDQLPNYQIQNMGNPGVDKILQSKEDIKTLKTSLENFKSRD